MEPAKSDSASHSASDFSEEHDHGDDTNDANNGAQSVLSPNLAEGEVAERSSKKPHKKSPRPDTPASLAFPMTRVRRLIKSEEEFRTNIEAAFLINKATERFLEQLLDDSFEYVQEENRNILSYKQLSSTVANQKRYEFLADFIPQKVRAGEALSEKVTAEN